LIWNGTTIASSDERLKTNVTNLPYAACQQVFDAIEARQYRRTDIETDKLRCGFIAQEVQAALPESMQNVVKPYPHTPVDGGDTVEYLGVDYARLTTVLWGVCKNQQAQLAALTARVVALESKGTKTKSK
jgi:hypothetical protein